MLALSEALQLEQTLASRQSILDEKREVLISFIFAYYLKTAIVLVS
jgi:hypothetical protein